MSWYAWLFVGILAFAVLALVGLRVLRASRRGRRFLALSTRAKVHFGRSLLADPQVGPVPKVALVLLVAYLAMPLDLVPDFVPVLGQLDDALVVLAAIGLLILAVPRERFEAALAEAEGEQRERTLREAKVVNPPVPPTRRE
jgi:uncharacterized membrane protein YkvA (DUF1232 family)